MGYLHGLGLAIWTTLASSAAAAQVTLHLEVHTDHPGAFFYPGDDLVHVKVSVRDSALQPLRAGELRIGLTSPAKNRFVSTDFPIVEGTTLLMTNAVLFDNSLEFDYRFPIRGTYELNAEWTSPGATERVTAAWPIKVPERPDKIRNLMILMIILAGVGGGSGVVLGRVRQGQMGVRL